MIALQKALPWYKQSRSLQMILLRQNKSMKRKSQMRLVMKESDDRHERRLHRLGTHNTL